LRLSLRAEKQLATYATPRGHWLESAKFCCLKKRKYIVVFKNNNILRNKTTCVRSWS